MGTKNTKTEPAAPAKRAAKPAAKLIAKPAARSKPAVASETADKPKTPKPAIAKRAPKPAAPKPPAYTAEDIALRAYFIAEKRQAAGLPGDSHQDWIEAERQLAAEAATAKKPRAKKA